MESKIKYTYAEFMALRDLLGGSWELIDGIIYAKEIGELNLLEALEKARELILKKLKGRGK